MRSPALPRPGLLPRLPNPRRDGLVLPLAVASCLSALWLILGPRTPDLAAQVYRSALFIKDGFMVWDNQWYGGHHVPGYSLLFPPLAALLGPRLVGALGAVASAVVFDRLAREHFGRRAWVGTVWFAVAVTADLLIGRLTFGLGVALGLGALLALSHRRRRLAAVLSFACAAASPVAAMFLALAGFTYAVTGRRWRDGLAVILPGLALVAVLGERFPEGGRQPFSHTAFWGTMLFAGLATILIPRRERTLRVGAWLYLLAALVTYQVHTPMGGNISRLAAEFAGPLLVCATWQRNPTDVLGRVARGLGRAARPISTVVLAAALLLLAGYQWNGPVHEVIKGDDASVNASYYQPMVAFIQRHSRPIGRVEVPFTLSHWDAALLPGRVPLARGWERQLDTKYDPLFYHGILPAGTYHAWLLANGVRYVALPDVRLDPSSWHEGALLHLSLPFLRPVWHGAHWRVWKVKRPRPLAWGAGSMTQLGTEDFTLYAQRAGVIRVLVHFTPYWLIATGAGCVSQGPGGWTEVRAARPGPLHVVAAFSLDRVFSHGQRCTPGTKA